MEALSFFDQLFSSTEAQSYADAYSGEMSANAICKACTYLACHSFIQENIKM